jgi:hypothetical protein
MWHLYKRLSIQAQVTMVFHPQANGKTERMNKEIAQYLRHFVSLCQDDWVDLLPLCKFVLNH